MSVEYKHEIGYMIRFEDLVAAVASDSPAAIISFVANGFLDTGDEEADWRRDAWFETWRELIVSYRDSMSLYTRRRNAKASDLLKEEMEDIIRASIVAGVLREHEIALHFEVTKFHNTGKNCPFTEYTFELDVTYVKFDAEELFITKKRGRQEVLAPTEKYDSLCGVLKINELEKHEWISSDA